MLTPIKYIIVFTSGALLVLGSTALAQIVPTMMHESVMFSDVQKGTFFEKSVAKLVRQGVVKGYENGEFGPNDSVTRAQVSVMIDRYDQEVIQNLRDQIETIRQGSNLGRCGDGIVQIGETCDDGNNTDGDNCSAICLMEKTIQPVSSGQILPPIVVPEGNACFYLGKKYAVGENFQAMDGCNHCSCAREGRILCTSFACVPEGECAQENETVYFDFVAGPGRPVQCCNGSAGILLLSTLLDDGSCTPIPVGGARGMCSMLCGNEVCDSGENICSCPQDCSGE